MSNRVPYQIAADTRRYEIFMPCIPGDLRAMGLVKRGGKPAIVAWKTYLAAFVRRLPGFVAFYGGNEWITDYTLGCNAIFVNAMYAGAAILDLECAFGAIIGNHYFDNDATPIDRFDAATIAFRRNPSAMHFARLETAMHEYQRASEADEAAAFAARNA